MRDPQARLPPATKTSPTARHVNRRACSSPPPPARRAAKRLADRAAIASGALGVRAHRRLAARLVERRVRRRDDRRAARHRLDDRHAEPLEPRRVDDGRRAAVEARELVVGDAAEPDHARHVEPRLRAPSGAADDREREVAAEEAERVDERAEVLARLERRHRQQVRQPEVGTSPSAVNTASTPGMRDADPLRRDPEQLRRLPAGVRGVDEDDVAALRRLVLRAVHRARPPRRPLREAHRHEVVQHRRADAGALRRRHPLLEVEGVERAEQPLGRRPAEPGSTRCASRARTAAARPQLDVDAVERARDLAPPARARRREGDDLVPPCRRLDQPASEPRM